MIVVTTQAGASVRRQVLEAGADSYLVKPCGVLQLGEVMAVASRHRSRLIAPDIYGVKPSRARLRRAVKRSLAIRERLMSDAMPPVVQPGGVH